MSEVPPKPTVFLKLVVTPPRYKVATFSANLGSVAAPGEYRGDLQVQVDQKFVSRDMEIRVRLKGNEAVTAQLWGWSSALEDDPSTPEFDERWKLIAPRSVQQLTTDVIELSGVFDPRKGVQ